MKAMLVCSDVFLPDCWIVVRWELCSFYLISQLGLDENCVMLRFYLILPLVSDKNCVVLYLYLNFQLQPHDNCNCVVFSSDFHPEGRWKLCSVVFFSEFSTATTWRLWNNYVSSCIFNCILLLLFLPSILQSKSIPKFHEQDNRSGDISL